MERGPIANIPTKNSMLKTVDKRTFKSSFHRLLEEQVDGIPYKGIIYSTKWTFLEELTAHALEAA